MTWIERCRKVFIDKIVIPVNLMISTILMSTNHFAKKKDTKEKCQSVYMHYFNCMYDNTGNDVYI